VSPIGEPRSGAPHFIDSNNVAYVRREKGGAISFELHEACAAWPEMTPADLRDLAADIAANGLHEPLTITPDGKLLDGRNRGLACVIAGVEPAFVTYGGDPWLFSLSKNKHRRHLTTDQIALVAARLATRTVGNPNFAIGSNEPIAITEAAEASGVSETAIKSAKVVNERGTPEEIESVRNGKAKLRKVADAVRLRARKIGRPPASKEPAQSANAIDNVARELTAKCADGRWRSLPKMASATQLAASPIKDALTRLGADLVQTREGASGFEYLILRDEDARWRSLLAAKDREIADLKRQLIGKDVEIAQLKVELQGATKPRRRHQEGVAETLPSKAAP
jgi:hypothetical protein